MKEIVVISGKGGTGKTSIAAALAMLAGKRAIIADCDVDAADMHLLLDPDFKKYEDFYSGTKAVIDPEKCTGCGECVRVCRFEAINALNGHFSVDRLSCEGCGYCSRVCPEKAITNEPVKAGRWYVSTIKNGSTMVHARLGIAADNSGKLVAKVKNEAKAISRSEDKKFVIVDGSPGIGCPVISSLSGANLVVLVTEPSVSGFHDLKRVVELMQNFRITAVCIINKYDLNPEMTQEITQYLEEENIELVATIPYLADFTRAMTGGLTIMEHNNEMLKGLMAGSWNRIEKIINQ